MELTRVPINISLPLPPTVNNMYANARGKGRVLTPEARKWKDDAILLTRNAMQRDGLKPPCRKDGFALEIKAFFPNNRRDLSNVLKITEDAVCTAIGIDDRAVGAIHLYKGRTDEAFAPGLLVTVW